MPMTPTGTQRTLLTSVCVKNFRCIRDSTEFSIDPKVTCLVGKNESGKTAILEAIERINPLPGEPATFEPLDYPRDLWSEYKERAATNPDDALITSWRLGDEDAVALEVLIGPSALRSRDFRILHGYYSTKKWDLDVDEAAVVRHLVSKAGFQEHATLKALHTALHAKADRTPPEQECLTHLEKHFPNQKLIEGVATFLASRLPRMVYVPDYFRLPGQVSIDDFKAKEQANQLTQPYRVFLALMNMVGATVAELADQGQYERLTAELEAVSNRLSNQIFEYWSQNRHLRVQIRFDAARPKDPVPLNSGFIVRTRIENTRHHVTVGFDERSAGFVWFFSFLVWFSQARKNYGDNLIILLDEPALSLHAKAQADLLRYFEEKLAPLHQVIYSTHSPFMVDSHNLLRARTVEDVFPEQPTGSPPPPADAFGTKVGDRVLSTDRDTIFPLQAALGYDITQTLFVGKHTLLVEGPSEILYIQWFQQCLRKLNRSTLDARWTIAPCGGIDKIPAFLSLFSGSELDIAVFTDVGTGSKKRVRSLRESHLLKSGRVLSADMYAGQAEADIEDLLGRDFYTDLVRQAFDLAATEQLPATRPADAPIRVVQETERHFRTLPPTKPEFDHYRPAEFLMQAGLQKSYSGLDHALTRFEKLFADLNALLPPT